MKNYILLVALFSVLTAFGQEESETEKKEEAPRTEESKPSDTTRFNVGGSEVIIVSKGENSTVEIKDGDDEDNDGFSKPKRKKSEAHWAGIDFGVTQFTNEVQGSSFPAYKYWENDASSSWYFNLNLLEKKFNIISTHVGLTTGLGFSFQSFGLRDNYDLELSADTLTASINPENVYSKNKLKASYFRVPLLLEFNSHKNNNKGFYLATGVVGGVRLSSKTKQIGKRDDLEFESKVKGDYGLESFQADAVVRIGYKDWGGHVSYSMLPLFDTDKTVAVHPLSFGLSYNF